MGYTATYALALGGGQAGLTMYAQFLTTAGSGTGGTVSAGFSSIGQGFYTWNATGIPDDFRGGVRFMSSANTSVNLAVASINPEVGEYQGTVEGTVNTKILNRVMLALAAGKATGGGTTAIYFRNQADNADRISLVVDASGNRTTTVISGA